MKFRTEIEVLRGSVSIEHDQKLFTIGSCFAENIAQRLSAARFSVLENPFGVLYNPASILTALELISGDRTLSPQDLVFHDGLWHSLLHHSTFSDAHKEVLLERIAETNKQTRTFIEESRHVILTLGTAFVFRYRKSARVVANCHKLPAEMFDRFRLSADEVRKYLNDSIRLLRTINPALHIIVTVSPIRHIKDGLVQNQLSKATLITGVHKALEGRAQTDYFPAYEILVDDLRDYRFYEENLTHPNTLALTYIWEKFKETFFSTECRKTVNDMEKLNKAIAHRPLHPQSQEHQRFVQRQLKEIDRLERKYPYVDFSEEKKYFRRY